MWTMVVALGVLGAAHGADRLEAARRALRQGWEKAPALGIDPAAYAVDWQTRCYANGLRTAVARAPGDRAAVHALVDRGAAADPEGGAGAAHLAEHLWFDSRPGGGPRVWDRLADLGATFNASTSPDHVSWWAVAPAESLGPLLDLEAGRLGAPLEGVTPDDVARAQGVLAAERRTAARGAIAAHQALLRMLYPDDPLLGSLVRETDESVAALALADLRTHARLRPADLTVVVAAPQPTDALHAAVARRLARGVPVAECPAPEAPPAARGPVGASEQRVFEAADSAAVVIVGWRVPADVSELRLHRAAGMLRHLLAFGADGPRARARWCAATRGPGRAEIRCAFSTPEGESAAVVAGDAIRGADTVVSRFSHADLDRAGHTQQAGLSEFDRDFSLVGLGALGTDTRRRLVVAGRAVADGLDPRLPRDAGDLAALRWGGGMPPVLGADDLRLDGIAEDLKAWVRSSHSAWVALRPTHDADGAAEAGRAPPARVEASGARIAPPVFPAGDIVVGSDAAGMPIIALHRPGSPGVSVALLAGPAPSPEDALAYQAWRGFGRADVDGDLLDFLGLDRQRVTSEGFRGMETRADASALADAVAVAARAVAPEGAPRSGRRPGRAALPAEVPTPARHFLGRVPEGRLTRPSPVELARAHAALAHPTRARLVIVGDVKPEAALAVAQGVLEGRSTGPEAPVVPVMSAPWPPPPREIVVRDRETARAHVQLTCAAPPGSAADPAVVSAWLGGAVRAALREDRGLVYSPAIGEADLAPLDGWTVTLETEPARVPTVVDVLLRAVSPEAVDAASLGHARNTAMGAWRRRLGTRAGWVRFLGGLPLGTTPEAAHAARTQRIEQSDPAAVQAALSACADHAVLTVYGPGEDIAGALDAAGRDAWLVD